MAAPSFAIVIEGVRLEIPVEGARLCAMFDEVYEIPFTKKDEAAARKLAEFLCFHATEPVTVPLKPLGEHTLAQALWSPRWDFRFFSALSDQETLALAELAKFVACDSLLKLCAVRVATVVRRLTPEEVRSHFHFPPSPLTKEQEDELIRGFYARVR